MKSKELENVLKIKQSHPMKPGLTLQEQRAEIEAIPDFPLAQDVRYEKVDVNGVPGEWISTSDTLENRVVYYFHGGAYVFESINSNREMISRLARSTKSRLLAIDYSLAPEHPFPAALEDAMTGYKWLLSKNIKPSELVIIGTSSGGGLAVSAMVALRDAGEELPAAAVCISPWVDLVFDSPSTTQDAQGDVNTWVDKIKGITKAYLGDTDPRTPLASPVYADLSELPPMLIQVGTEEGLLDDAVRLAERAKSYGVEVMLEKWEDMIHLWHSFAPILPEGQQAIDKIGIFVEQHIK